MHWSRAILHVDMDAFYVNVHLLDHPADGSLASAIPAVVSQLLVAPGDVVAAGDKLILLESMKMVIPILAPHAGRVSRVHCAPGDSVPAGVALLEIEAE